MMKTLNRLLLLLLMLGIIGGVIFLFYTFPFLLMLFCIFAFSVIGVGCIIGLWILVCEVIE